MSTSESVRFSDLIQHFVNDRDNAKPFIFGEWLKHLGDDGLMQLRRRVSHWFDTAQCDAAADDIVAAGIIGLAAQRQPQLRIGPREIFELTSQLQPEDVVELVNQFNFVVELEVFRRRAWVNVLAPLSIEPDSEAQVTLTEAGLNSGRRADS